MNKKILILLILLPFIFHVERAFSQGCTLNVTPLHFGNYDIFSSNPTDTTGTITIHCDDVVWAEVALGVSSTSGTFNPRRMRRLGGSDLIDYNIYTTPARTVIFGDGTGGTETVGVHKPPGTPAKEPWTNTVSIYGRIFPHQDVSAGTYSDNLTATVTP